MSKVRARDTAPELILRKALSSRGARYRLYVAGLPGRPDIAFKTRKIAVFCDGDFWHGRGWRKRKESQFHVRKKYWQEKIEANLRRDRRVNRRLRKEGWLVLRYWGSKINTHGPEIAVEILSFLKSSRRAPKPRFHVRNSDLQIYQKRYIIEV